MDPKPWYSSKTIWFAILLVGTGIANMFGFDTFTPDATTSALIGQILTVVGGVVGLLRVWTSRPLGSNG